MKKLSKQQKGYIGIVAVLLAVILALGITLGVATKWGKDTENLKPNKEEAYTGMLMPGEEETNGISLVSTVIPKEHYADYGIMPIATSAYKITATVKVNGVGETPDYMKGVTWTMQWQGSVSSPVTDYVTMTDSDDSATFACKKAFSTQIVVTVKSKYDTSKTATATLDYRKQVKGVKVKVGTQEGTAGEPGTDGPVLSATFPVRFESSSSIPSSGDWVDTSFFNWFGDIIYGEGTLSPTGSSGEIKIEPTAEFQAKYNAIKNSSLSDMVTSITANKNASNSMEAIKHVVALYQSLTGTSDGTSLVGMGALSALSTAISQTNNQLKVTLTANGVEVPFTIDMNADSEASVSVQLDNTSIIFE